MKYKSLLRLHEAVAVILLIQAKKTATFQKIADQIEKRNLFQERKSGITLAHQIKLGTSIASSKYKYRFQLNNTRNYFAK